MARGQCRYSRRRQPPSNGDRRMSLSPDKNRVSLSREEMRVSLSQEERRFPDHSGKESRLRCTTHGEEGSQVHPS